MAPMALEIERKFLVENGDWREATETSRRIVQAYLALDGDVSVRVRISDDRAARIAVKIGQSGLNREEFEYPVPLEDARRMIAANARRLIEKTRYTVTFEGFLWEIDAYQGALSGLVIAEVELESEDDDPRLPAWVGREVTGDNDWSNARLAIAGLPEEARV